LNSKDFDKIFYNEHATFLKRQQHNKTRKIFMQDRAIRFRSSATSNTILIRMILNGQIPATPTLLLSPIDGIVTRFVGDANQGGRDRN